MLILLFACENKAPADKKNQWAMIDLPDLSSQPIRLSVANVVNTRFQQLSRKQIDDILKRCKTLVKQNFDIDIEFTPVTSLDIEEVFSGLKPLVLDERKKEIVDINHIDAQVREDMQHALFKTLSKYHGNKENVIEFAQPYLLHPDIREKDIIGLSYALVDTLISRLNYWKTQNAADGRPVLDGNNYHQWVLWDSLGYGDLPYDIVITNQLVASAEYYGMDVHSSIRGGITAGTTTYNKNTQFKTYAYIMVYPMLNDTELLTRLRGDETYSEQQIIDYSAALLTHELGHLLLHLGHPFGDKNCIMSPTVMLNYRDWYDSLDAGKCRLGSSHEMTQGAASLEYNKSW